MAINPMQRKANNSFILGIVVTLLITGCIIAFLIMQISKINKEMEAMKTAKKEVYVLSYDIKSGEPITSAMLESVQLDVSVIPENAIIAATDLSGYSLCDKNGNEINTYYDTNANQAYYGITLANSETPIRLVLDEETGTYFYEKKNGLAIEKVYVEFMEQPLIAKVDMSAKTLLTSTVLRRGDLLTDDTRIQEYNIFSLPSQLMSGDIVDIRLRLPSGEDYIVASHKEVTIPNIAGVDSTNCVWFRMTEAETLTMSSAIIETYQIEGAKLYAVKYIEAGNQDAATLTYLPSDRTLALMQRDPNVVEEAKKAIFDRYGNNDYKNAIRNPINNATNNNDAKDNVIDKVQEEIQGLQEEREQYIESLDI